MVIRGCPCQECTERYEACHDVCPAFRAWKERKDEIMRDIKHERQMEHMQIEQRDKEKRYWERKSQQLGRKM